MQAADLASVKQVSDEVHPGYPEDPPVFADRLRLYPEGCFVYDANGKIFGYAITHPWQADEPPALNTLLRRLPDATKSYYIHDIALLPQIRSGGQGSTIVRTILAHARERGFEDVRLIAVNDSGAFWERHGFVRRDVPALRQKLQGYSSNAAYMRCAL